MYFEIYTYFGSQRFGFKHYQESEIIWSNKSSVQISQRLFDKIISDPRFKELELEIVQILPGISEIIE